MRGCVLYRFWHEDTLLYVGKSIQVWVRLQKHFADSHFFKEATSITFQKFASEEELNEAERVAIQTEQPEYNITYSEAPWRGGWTRARSLRVAEAERMEALAAHSRHAGPVVVVREKLIETSETPSRLLVRVDGRTEQYDILMPTHLLLAALSEDAQTNLHFYSFVRGWLSYAMGYGPTTRLKIISWHAHPSPECLDWCDDSQVVASDTEDLSA